MSTHGTPSTHPVKTKSKAYNSTVAIQGDAAKYRLKYKELKKKTREIETENEKLHFKTLRIKRNIQRMRLERAILYERLEAEAAAATSSYPPPSGRHEGDPTDSYPHHGVGPSGAAPSYAASYDARSGVGAGAGGGGGGGGEPYPYREHEYGYPATSNSRAHSPTAPRPGLTAAQQQQQQQQVPLASTPAPPSRASGGDRSSMLRQYTPSASPDATGRATHGEAA